MDHGIRENADVSLHDCRTNQIQYEKESIKFFLPDGFYWIRNEKTESDHTESYQAEMTCRIVDKYGNGFRVSVYRKNLFGQTVREDWTEKFIPAINRGKIEFEFVYTYRSYHGILFKGYIWRKRKPWWRECEIELRTDEITYSWSERPAEPVVIVT